MRSRWIYVYAMFTIISFFIKCFILSRLQSHVPIRWTRLISDLNSAFRHSIIVSGPMTGHVTDEAGISHAIREENPLTRNWSVCQLMSYLCLPYSWPCLTAIDFTIRVCGHCWPVHVILAERCNRYLFRSLLIYFIYLFIYLSLFIHYVYKTIMWHFIGRHLIARQLNGDSSPGGN